MGLYLEDFVLNSTQRTRGRTIGEGDVSLFAGLVGDYNPLHTDPMIARRTQRTTLFPGPAAAAARAAEGGHEGESAIAAALAAGAPEGAAAEGGDHRGEELRGQSRARLPSSRRGGHPRGARAGAVGQDQVLDQAGP